MKKLFILLVIAFALYQVLEKNPNLNASFTHQNTTNAQQITKAFQSKQSNVQVIGVGIVIRHLADDTKGRQHQKFILQLSSGQTLLISHNINLSNRINMLRKGDTVEFYGEYEWSAKGG